MQNRSVVLGTHPWKMDLVSTSCRTVPFGQAPIRGSPFLAHEAFPRCRGASQLSDNHVGLAITTINDGDFLWREVTKMLRALKAAGYKIVGVLEQGTWHFHTVKLRRSLFACMKSTSIVQSRTRATHLRAPTSLGDVSACTLEVGHVSASPEVASTRAEGLLTQRVVCLTSFPSPLPPSGGPPRSDSVRWLLSRCPPHG